METSGISLHYEKHKGNTTAVNGLQRHNEREQGQKHSNKNIDDNRTKDNVFLRRSPKRFKDEIEDKIKSNKKDGLKGVRKNSVRMIEATVQLSGKILEQPEVKQEEVLKDMYEWLKTEHGEENIVSAVIHKDETSMHLHFDFVPITADKRLSARDVLGSRGDLKKKQQRSLKHVQEKHKSMNFKRKEHNEFNGLSQKDFETLQKMKEESERELKEKEARLNAKIKDKVYKQAKALDERKKEQNERAKEQDSRDRQLNSREDDLNAQEKDIEKREKSLVERESLVDGRETTVEARESEVGIKDKEAEKKLLEAQNERNKAEELLEQVKGLKKNLARNWERILDMIRAGELRSREVEEVAEKYDPFSDDKLEDFSQDVLELSKRNKSQGRGL